MTISTTQAKKAIKDKNIQNFNNLGGASMYNYKIFSDDELDKDQQEVMEKLGQIDKKYSLEEFTPNEITSLGLEKKTFEKPSEDDIKSEAESSLKAEKENGLKKIQDNYNTKFSSLDSKALDLEEDRNEDVEKVFSDYANSLRRATNKTIKQGISRSSIFEDAVNAIEESKNSELLKIEDNFKKQVSKLENEREILEQQKDNALGSFDISYALKLDNKIASINKEIAKQQEEVLKFNKNVDKLEEENRIKQEKANSSEQSRIEKKNKELLALKEKLGERKFTAEILKERFDVVKDYLMKLPKDKAIEEVKKEKVYTNLLGNYYPAIVAQILGRKD